MRNAHNLLTSSRRFRQIHGGTATNASSQILSTFQRGTGNGRSISNVISTGSVCHFNSLALSDFKHFRDDEEERPSSNRNNSIMKRSYHSTAKREILPLIAVGSIAFLGTYSYRALKRMDSDWEDYEEALREYRLEHGLADDEEVPSPGDGSTRSATHSFMFTDGKLAIDLGTMNIRIAHKSSTGEPKIIVNREGSRTTPNAIMVEQDGTIMSGKLAAAKRFERSNSNRPVLNPSALLRDYDGGDSMTKNYAVESVLSNLAKDALEQAAGSSKNTSSSKTVFSLSSGAAGYNAQPIFTYPPASSTSENEKYLHSYQEAVKGIIESPHMATFLPEPLCAVKGGRHFNLLPTSSIVEPVMVIDVGGEAISMSVVKGDSIKYHTRLEGFGGETLVDACMNYLSKSFYGKNTTDVSDTMGVQRLYDASSSAVTELSGGSKPTSSGRVEINIPYLSVDEKMQPKHLNLGVSMNVLKAEFNDLVRSKIIPNNAVEQGVLSKSMQVPGSLEKLFGSMITRIFEESGQNPFAISNILIVGGAARSPLFLSAIKSAVGSIAGEQYAVEKIVVPPNELLEELVVMGAAMSETSP